MPVSGVCWTPVNRCPQLPSSRGGVCGTWSRLIFDQRCVHSTVSTRDKDPPENLAGALICIGSSIDKYVVPRTNNRLSEPPNILVWREIPLAPFYVPAKTGNLSETIYRQQPRSKYHEYQRCGNIVVTLTNVLTTFPPCGQAEIRWFSPY